MSIVESKRGQPKLDDSRSGKSIDIQKSVMKIWPTQSCDGGQPKGTELFGLIYLHISMFTSPVKFSSLEMSIWSGVFRALVGHHGATPNASERRDHTCRFLVACWWHQTGATTKLQGLVFDPPRRPHAPGASMTEMRAQHRGSCARQGWDAPRCTWVRGVSKGVEVSSPKTP